MQYKKIRNCVGSYRAEYGRYCPCCNSQPISTQDQNKAWNSPIGFHYFFVIRLVCIMERMPLILLICYWLLGLYAWVGQYSSVSSSTLLSGVSPLLPNLPFITISIRIQGSTNLTSSIAQDWLGRAGPGRLYKKFPYVFLAWLRLLLSLFSLTELTL